MDPNATLEHIRDLAGVLRMYNGNPASKADELVDAINDLDEWLSKGGFLPDDWQEVDA